MFKINKDCFSSAVFGVIVMMAGIGYFVYTGFGIIGVIFFFAAIFTLTAALISYNKNSSTVREACTPPKERVQEKGASWDRILY